MKAKLLMLMMAIGMLLSTPMLSYAQGFTDEDLEFQGGDYTGDEFGPVSLDPIVVKGNVSFINQEITLNFLEDMGTITIWIIDENGNLYLSKEVNTTEEVTTKMDIKALPAQKYTIVCFTPMGQQGAYFELRK